MKSQISRAALHSMDLTEYLIMSMRIYKPNVSIGLTGIFGPPAGDGTGDGTGDGVPAPDWDQVQESYIGLLETSAKEVRRLDQVHRLNKVKLSEGRYQRARLVDELRIRHRDLRKSFSGTYGEDALPLVGLDAPPEDRYLAVREQQLETLERMRDPELSSRLPATRAGQAAFDLTALADAIETEILELEAAMEAIQRMRTQVDESKVVKDETLKQHRRHYVHVARIMESYFHLAGLDELIERFRAPDRPKRRSKSEGPDEAHGDPSGDREGVSEDSEEAPESPA